MKAIDYLQPCTKKYAKNVLTSGYVWNNCWMHSEAMYKELDTETLDKFYNESPVWCENNQKLKGTMVARSQDLIRSWTDYDGEKQESYLRFAGSEKQFYTRDYDNYTMIAMIDDYCVVMYMVQK